MNKLPLRLYASAKSVITLFLTLPGTDRVNHVIGRLDIMNAEETGVCLEEVRKEFGSRHRNLEKIFLHHYEQIARQYKSLLSGFPMQKKLLLGAFFTKEYSIEAAALFNPSIVPHPDQSGLRPDELRFVMSLRATGEGHISSIVFRTGIVDGQGNILLDAISGYFSCLQKNPDFRHEKKFIQKLTGDMPLFQKHILDKLPRDFTAGEARDILEKSFGGDVALKDSVRVFEDILDMNYELTDPSDLSLDEKVIFPNSRGESMGMEDLRLVRFEDQGKVCYYGTYTAYNGREIRTQLIETNDFAGFKIRTLNGAAINDKGMALFPEKVNGKYVMISRQGGENINIMFSGDLYSWEKYEILMKPRFVWELLQLGNCGSPVRTEKGWLLLTHGVGAMRKYVISVILLDLQNPTRIVGRLHKPLIEADETEREGYVPNVVYTCGCLLHGDFLVIPYAVSDSATGFVTFPLNDLLKEIIYE